MSLADAVLYWYDTTHGNSFGHDHHCPVRATEEPFQEQPDDRCTCGWSGVLVAERERYEESLRAKQATDTSGTSSDG